MGSMVRRDSSAEERIALRNGHMVLLPRRCARGIPRDQSGSWLLRLKT